MYVENSPLCGVGGCIIFGMSVHFSSKTNEWDTPKDFYETLDREFHFTLDPATNGTNSKCARFYTQADDGLAQSWDNEAVFCNPPYGREIGRWIEKASKATGGVVVMLIPARTDTRYFHDYIYNKAEIRFLRGRLKFGGSKNSAPFPSMLVIFRK